MGQWIIDIFIGFFRIILWLIVSICFWFINILLEVLKTILSIDFLNSYGFVWEIYYGFVLVAISFFITYRVFKLYLKAIASDDFDKNFKVTFILKRLFVICVVLLLLPYLLKTISTFTSSLASGVNKVFNVDNLEIQSVFCSSDYIGSCPTSDKTTDPLSTVSVINEWSKATKSYTYIPNSFNLIVMLLPAYAIVKILITLIVSVSTRVVGILFNLPIGVYIISSLVEEGNDSFGKWASNIVTELFVCYLQLVFVFIALNLPFNINLPENTNGNGLMVFIIRMCILIGSLLSLVNMPGKIAQFIGVDISGATAFQQGNAVANMLKSGGKLAAGGTALAGGLTYGATKMSGKSLFSGFNHFKNKITGQSGSGGVEPISSFGGNNFSKPGFIGNIKDKVAPHIKNIPNYKRQAEKAAARTLYNNLTPKQFPKISKSIKINKNDRG